jgi:hypothetical protein
MKQLYQLFKQASVLGSLIDPKRVGGHLFAANFEGARPLLERALTAEHGDFAENELAVTAKGLLATARILGDEFVLVATNVPYLGRGKQQEDLKDYAERFHPAAKADLATCMVERCLSFLSAKSTVALVCPQNWLFLTRYKALRSKLLAKNTWNYVARLGSRAFETVSGEIVNVALVSLTAQVALPESVCALLNVSNIADKKAVLADIEIRNEKQARFANNPDLRIVEVSDTHEGLLSDYAISKRGIVTGDRPFWVRLFWEFPECKNGWRFLQSTVEVSGWYGGREHVINWTTQGSGMLRPGRANESYGNAGICISLMHDLRWTLYTGELYDNNCGAIVPHESENLAAIAAYCSSPAFVRAVRGLDAKLNVTNATLVKVPFDLADWRIAGEETFSGGLPKPHSSDPTQWLFNGNPRDSDYALQVAVARLLAYHWPRQTGSSFPECPALGEDGLERFAAEDGVVCLTALQGKPSAVDRLSALLAIAFGKQWPSNQQTLLNQATAKSTTLEEWLRDEFFAQHCDAFHNRPFIWHVSDGLDQGFHALVNYHNLVAPNGEGKRTLEKLTYTYLGEWIERQRSQQKQGLAGSDARLASALHLQDELKKILAGEIPYDIFARWKPLYQQAIGWEPEITDGIRSNIRPFIIAKALGYRNQSKSILRTLPQISWKKDEGKDSHREKHDYPWAWNWDQQTNDYQGGPKFDGNRWNDLHYSLEMKRKARAQHESKAKKGQHA